MIKLNHLTTGYNLRGKTKTVSFGLDVKIEKGSLIGVLGGNGIGKSTLLKTIAGFEKPIKGSVLIDEKSIHEMNLLEKAQCLSIVLTDRKVNGDLLGKEVIQLGRQPHTNWIGSHSENDKAFVLEIIDELNLNELVNQKVKNLSDGEFQKIVLARALSQDTSVLLLDEPSTHLDLYNKAVLYKQIKRIVSDKKKTVLFTSHDLNSAIQICDKILLLLEDRWEFGTPNELIKKGVFQNVFPEETVGFDPILKQFRICI